MQPRKSDSERRRWRGVYLSRGELDDVWVALEQLKSRVGWVEWLSVLEFVLIVLLATGVIG